jgi:hypothetical protein
MFSLASPTRARAPAGNPAPAAAPTRPAPYLGGQAARPHHAPPHQEVREKTQGPKAALHRAMIENDARSDLKAN